MKSMLLSALRTTRGKVVLAVLIAIAVFQLWLTIAAPGKISPEINREARRVDVMVTLPFPPERFHIQKFQDFGRVSGTRENSVHVRGVNVARLNALARPYWVRSVEPLKTGG